MVVESKRRRRGKTLPANQVSGAWMTFCDMRHCPKRRGPDYCAGRQASPSHIQWLSKGNFETEPPWNDHRHNVTLDTASTLCYPFVAVYAQCSCVNPADLPYSLWLRALADLDRLFQCINARHCGSVHVFHVHVSKSDCHRPEWTCD
jgi:hypothetical protein